MAVCCTRDYELEAARLGDGDGSHHPGPSHGRRAALGCVHLNIAPGLVAEQWERSQEQRHENTDGSRRLALPSLFLYVYGCLGRMKGVSASNCPAGGEGCKNGNR